MSEISQSVLRHIPELDVMADMVKTLRCEGAYSSTEEKTSALETPQHKESATLQRTLVVKGPQSVTSSTFCYVSATKVSSQ